MVSNLFLRFPGGKSKALTLSYDDGVTQDIRLMEILRKNGLKCTFNLNSGLLGKGKRLNLTAEDVVKAYDPEYFEVACHGVTHPYFTKCDDALLMSQTVYDRKNLETLMGTQIHGMAYPMGDYDARVINVLKNTGIYYARTTKSTLNFDMPSEWLEWNPTCHHKNPKLLELADNFIAPHKRRPPQVFYVWGHAYEFDDDDNWSVIEKFAEKLSGHDNIWYATNIEIYLAWRDFSRLKYSADGTLIYNPNARDVWVADAAGNVFVIKSGETYKRG